MNETGNKILKTRLSYLGVLTAAGLITSGAVHTMAGQAAAPYDEFQHQTKIDLISISANENTAAGDATFLNFSETTFNNAAVFIKDADQVKNGAASYLSINFTHGKIVKKEINSSDFFCINGDSMLKVNGRTADISRFSVEDENLNTVTVNGKIVEEASIPITRPYSSTLSAASDILSLNPTMSADSDQAIKYRLNNEGALIVRVAFENEPFQYSVLGNEAPDTIMINNVEIAPDESAGANLSGSIYFNLNAAENEDARQERLTVKGFSNNTKSVTLNLIDSGLESSTLESLHLIGLDEPDGLDQTTDFGFLEPLNESVLITSRTATGNAGTFKTAISVNDIAPLSIFSEAGTTLYSMSI